jgi:hypothetical protein
MGVLWWWPAAPRVAGARRGLPATEGAERGGGGGGRG